MSANSYTDCPRCVAEYRALVARVKSETAAAYGKVSQEEYARLQGSCDRIAAKASWPEQTLAEYEESTLDMNCGEFEYTYSVRCSKCALTWSTTLKAQMPKHLFALPKEPRAKRS